MAFRPATTDIRPRVLMSLDGIPGSGRTRFALSAPRPLAIISLDKGGTEGLIQDEAGIDIAEYPYFKNISHDAARRIAEEVENDIVEARDSHRTVLIDKADGLWQLFRLAEFGRLAGVQARKYEGVNTRMSELLRSFVDTDTNLLLIHDLTDDYEGEKVVGRKRAGFNGVDGIVRHAAMFSGGRDGNPFLMSVTRCTPNWDIVGMEFTGDEINFPQYAANALPTVDASAWL